MMGLGIIVAMWWTYFDVNALAAERHLRALSSVPRVRLAQHVFTYLHLPMIIGAIFFSLGVKKTLAHTDEVLSMIPAVALCGGLILYLLGQVALRARCGGSVAWPRILAALALGALTQIHRRDDYAAAERAIGAREGDGPGTIWGRGGPVSVFSCRGETL